MRINEDYIDNMKPDELADDYSSLSMDVRQNVEKYGEDCNLNWIDVSGRHNFSNIFYGSKFNGDISKWELRHVKSMDYMLC